MSTPTKSLSKSLPVALLSALIALFPAIPITRAAEPEVSAQATIPLSHYLELQERIRTVERRGDQEPALAELVAQQTSVVVEDASATIHTVFEVEVRGDHRQPVPLPLTGFASRATVEPAGGAALHRSKTGLELVPRRPGTYRVEVEGGRVLEKTPTGQRLTLAASGAPVASTELDLPAELEWKSPGAVVVGDEISGDRRRIRLALPRGRAPSIELGRRLGDEPAEQALVQSSLVTVLDLDPAGTRRHDIVLYEVLRGEVSSFELTLPPGLSVDQVGTDEGEATPLQAESAMTVHRDRRLTGTGYIAVTSLAPGSGSVRLAPVRPSVPVRSHYLVLAASVAAEVVPRPEETWVRVDLDDLPATVREDLRSLRPTAAWRRTGEVGDRALDAGLSVTLAPLPPVPVSRAVVTLRETTTLLTREGSLVHQDRFTVRRVVSAFEVQVPAGMRLWSASVDGREVRPVVRGERLAVPLTLQGETESKVEVVVLEKERLPEKRSQLAVTLPRVELPVLEHRWRLLLPETHRYRYEEGTLPVATQGRSSSGRLDSVAEEIVVNAATGSTPSPRKRELEREAEERQQQVLLKDEMDRLNQGLVGGVRPLPVEVPETGKLLFLAGALPPEQVTALVSVKGR